VKTVSGKVVRHSLAQLSEQKLLVSDTFYLKFGSNWPRWSEIADFRYLFVRSDSDV